MTPKTTWAAPKLSASQINAKNIIAAVDRAETPRKTAQICELLAITKAQFHSAKPYLAGYKTVGLHWYAPENIEAAKKIYCDQKMLLQYAHNQALKRRQPLISEVRIG